MYRRTFVLILLAASLVLTGCCNTCKRQHFGANRPGCNTCNSAFVPARVQPRPTVVAPIPSPPPRQLPARPPIARMDGPEAATYREPLDRDSAPINEPAPDPMTPDDAILRQPPATLGPPRSLYHDRRSVARPYAYVPPAVANVPNKSLPKNDVPEPKVTNPVIVLNVKTAVKDVSSGLPPYPEDFSWLGRQGYRSVLNLRDPGREDPAGKRLAERAGLKYQSLVASPGRLDRRLYEDFVKIANEANDQPLYVYHKDGTVAGGLWYLYFHLHKGESDEAARAKAKTLGLNFADPNDPHFEMVEAVQKFVADNKE